MNKREKYVASKFNKLKHCHNGLVLVNTLYGSSAKFSNEEDIKKIENGLLCLEYYPDDESRLSDYLKEKKFVVSAGTNEDARVRMMKADYVLNNRLSITIMPTEQCNFRCKYCYESFKGKKMAKEVQDSIIEFVRKNIMKFNSVDLSWYGGEPLLCKDVIEYISENVKKICKAAKRPLTTSITTNAYYLDLDTYKMLQKYNLVNVQVTIDGIKETHDKQRVLANGEGTYDTIMNNLLDIKNKTKSAIQKIIIRTNVSKDIYAIMDQYIDQYDRMFGDDSRFTFLIRPVGDWGGDAVKDISDKLMNQDSFKMVYNKLLESDKCLDMTFINGYLQPAGSVCYAARRHFYLIRSNGDVNKCTCVLDSEYNHLGKLLSDGTMDIDEDKMAKWVGLPDLKKCSNCNFMGSCLSDNCPMRKINDTIPHLCGYEKQYLDETIMLLDKCNYFEEYNY